MFRSDFAALSMIVVALAAARLGPTDLRAEQSDGTQEHWSAEKILAPEPGRKACWRRVYDAKHLAAHPQQKVTELIFFLRVSGLDAGGNYVFKNPHHIVYNFAMSLKRRNDKRALAVGGDCLGQNKVECVVDCDGGGVTIDGLPSGDGLSVSLDQGGIGFGGDCDTTRGIWVKPGADDRVFHLDPVAAEACTALEKEQLGGWNNQPAH